MSEDHRRILEQQLWNIANTLRGKMGADEFRDYILGFIFYKYLSERMLLYANEILEPDGLDYLAIDENNADSQDYLDAIKGEAIVSLGYFLRPSELFSEIVRRGNAEISEDGEIVRSNFILADLTRIFNNIQQSTMGTESEDDFDNLFEDIDLTSSKLGKTEGDKNAIIVKVMSHLSKIDFSIEDADSDVLGDAYEYLISQFASGAGKKAGEFYTPAQVSTILARLVTMGKDRIKSAYDPTTGSGSLLLRIRKNVKECIRFYGQELNRTTYNLARMNMILHGLHYRDFDIRQEDTLERPQHMDLKFEAIVANPPFSAQWSAAPIHLSDDRFAPYGKLAPSSKADFAFVQHMIYHLSDNGIMAIVLPHGVLFRGGAEGHIRQYLIEDKNYLDAVIGLPANIFYGTSIPTCILVFKKCREQNDHILFIDASNDYEKVKTQNILRHNDVDKIIDTYASRQTIEKYSYAAGLDEIKANDYNLNIPRYVDTFEEEVMIDINAVAKEVKALDAEMMETDVVLARFCTELGIETPF